VSVVDLRETGPPRKKNSRFVGANSFKQRLRLYGTPLGYYLGPRLFGKLVDKAEGFIRIENGLGSLVTVLPVGGLPTQRPYPEGSFVRTS